MANKKAGRFYVQVFCTVFLLTTFVASGVFYYYLQNANPGQTNTADKLVVPKLNNSEGPDSDPQQPETFGQNTYNPHTPVQTTNNNASKTFAIVFFIIILVIIAIIARYD